MKNVKLTLAATLSALAMTISGTAFADGMDRQFGKKGFDTKSYVSKQASKQFSKQANNKVNRIAFKQAQKKKVVKRVIVKKAHGKNVFITKKVVTKRAPTRYVKNVRFNQGKKYNQRVSYNTRHVIKNRQNHRNGYKVGKTIKNFTYLVLPGDTLYRISLKTGVSVNKLARMNRLNPERVINLQIGQRLRLS